MNIHDYLNPNAILIHSDAKTSSDVICELGNLLYTLGYVNDGFVEATLAREAEMPTGLPLGTDYNAAIPHVDIEYVHQSALALATLKEPVIFYNMVDQQDEVPVSIVIMLALDQPKSQIEMLQSVAALLQQPDLIESIMKASTQQEILNYLKSAS